MSASPEIRGQLQTLSIPKDLRPMSAESSGRGVRWGWMLLFMVVITGGVIGYLQRERIMAMIAEAAPVPEVRLMTVIARRESDQPPVLTATGKIVSDHRVNVATKVSGQIVSLHFEQGDHVAPGQTLARIEDVIYRARRDEAAATLEKSKANLEYQQINYRRIEELHEARDAMDIEFADAKRAVSEAVAQVAADRASLEYAEKALRDCEVTAPIAGVILERNVEVGDFVAAEGGRGAMANSQFATIADMSKLRVEVDISELDIARIHQDDPCTIVPDAYKDRRYQGRVMWLDPGANYSKATVQAKVRIENPDAFLRVEGSAQVSFMADSTKEAVSTDPIIWIPLTACRLESDGAAGSVFREKDGRLVKTPVILGRRQGGQVEVTGGLSDGQTIVSENVATLSDGQRIRK